MNSKLKATFALMLCVTLLSVATAAILLQKQIQTSMRVERTVAMEVFDTDGTTVLTAINFGDFLWGTNYFYPGKTTIEPIQTYYVNNTDQTNYYVMAQLPSPDPNIIFQIRFRRLDTSWSEWQDATNKIYPQPLISKLNNPDPNVQALQWQLRVWVVAGAPFGDHTPTLTFSAVSTPSG
jgi:hypothetical protein